ncbi:MAG: AAA family ATPase, partial [Rhodospirillales bacterium]|nr:AAA family ATPase [Rhodospirillales bacterium]
AGELEAFALAHSPGRHTLGEIRDAVEWMVRDGHLVEAGLRRTDRAFVTDRALKAERATIETMKAGIGRAKALAEEETVAAHLAGAGLTEGQEEAVRTILLARDRTVGVQGRAGTGKTTMLRQVRELAGDRRVVGLAPSAAAARVLEREAGIHARTLQWFLTRCQGAASGRADDKLNELFGGAVLVLDEASMTSTDQMRSLMRIADGLGVARLVLVGDTRQLQAVEAGQPFRQLQQAGMTTAAMDDILRQKNPELKAAVEAALAGKPDEAVEMLGNGLVEVGHEELAAKAAETWLALDRETRDGTLLLAPTHALREDINRTVREALAEEGVLRGRTLTIQRLVNLGMTRAERGDVRNYREDDEVVFNQDLVNYRLRKDEVLTVTGIDGDRVVLAHPDGKPRRIRPAGPIRYRFDVYETREIELRAGDRIRWTRNDRKRTLINGEKAEVTEIARGRVRLRLEDGRAISLKEDDPQLRHIDHAWSTTVHGAQGSTAEGVIAVLDSSHRALTDQSTFYVEISRARDNAVVLTDNLEQLVEVLAAQTGERPTAWEGLGEPGEIDPERLARALKEKAPVWTPAREWRALEARARADGTVLFLVGGYGTLIVRTRLLARTPDLPAEVREVADGLLAYDRACREEGRAAEEFLGLLEAHAGKRRGLEEAAEGQRRAVVWLDGYADWRGMTGRLAGNAAAVVETTDGRAADAADAIARRIDDLRGLTVLDDASLAFETLRIGIEGRAQAANTIPFYCVGHEDLVEKARELVPLTAPYTYMRGAAEAVIADREACRERHEEIGALRDAAAACLEARNGLEARAGAEPPTGLGEYAAWSARCAAAEERWQAIRDDPDTWRPHLDRRGEDAEKIEADMERLADLRGLDAAWAEFLEMRLEIADEARALDCDAFDLDRWDDFAGEARAGRVAGRAGSGGGGGRAGAGVRARPQALAPRAGAGRAFAGAEPGVVEDRVLHYALRPDHADGAARDAAAVLTWPTTLSGKSNTGGFGSGRTSSPRPPRTPSCGSARSSKCPCRSTATAAKHRS